MVSAAKPGFGDLVTPTASAPAPRVRSRRPDVRDPLAPVLGLEALAASRRGLAAGLAGALLLHLVAAGAATRSQTEMGDFVAGLRTLLAAAPPAEVDIDLTAVADLLPPTPPPVREPAIVEPTTPVPTPTEVAPAASPEPPAAAEAGQALTAEPDPDAPLDLTEAAFTLVTGTAQRYPGGHSDRAGTAKTAAHDSSARGAGPTTPLPPGPVGAAPPPPTPDQSRPAGVLGSTNWSSCPFPAEAELAQVTAAQVQLVVSVDARGRATSAVVQSESPSGYGFGARARQCALARRFEPARDGAGRPVAGKTPPLNVRFTQ